MCGNISIYHIFICQTCNSILFLESLIKVEVTHFDCVCVCVYVLLITLHVDHLPLYNWECFKKWRWCVHGWKFLLLHNTFSCPCSHVVLQSAKAGNRKFLQRKVYNVRARLKTSVSYHLATAANQNSPYLADHSHSLHSALLVRSECFSGPSSGGFIMHSGVRQA